VGRDVPGTQKKVDGSSNPAFLKLEAYEGYPKLVIDDSQLWEISIKIDAAPTNKLGGY